MRLKSAMKLGLAAVLATLGTSAMAEPMDSKSAKAMLFSAKGFELVLLDVDFLDDKSRAMLTLLGDPKLYKGANKKLTPRYYGAIAIAPDEGLLSPSNQTVVDVHSIAIAETLARQQCDALREGGAACQVVAHILPVNWEAKDVQLSTTATEAYKKFARGKGPRALAISSVNGAFASAKGETAHQSALDACNSQPDNDCVVVVADD